jgi:beta-N-acetylhexosaminidase
VIEDTCGQLIIGGFPGTSLSERFARALRQHRRGGAILFKRNLGENPRDVTALTRAIRAAAHESPLLGVDQEGGRVTRLHAPLLVVPPMRTVASWEDLALAERIARTVGIELACLGFTIDFAPVLDVNTCAHNPVIGDRAFGDDPDTCARFGTAWIRGLQSAGLLACGKHYPGHGDTAKDSHIELPVVDRRRDHLERVELTPFRAATAAGVAAMMTAHVIYPAIDAQRPATLSPTVCQMLRDGLGFAGMLVSDDLEMAAIAQRWSIDEAAVEAVAAGCDALLIGSNEDKQEQALEALIREAELSPSFRARCEEARAHVVQARRRATARPLDDDDEIGQVIGGVESQALADEMARRLGQ